MVPSLERPKRSLVQGFSLNGPCQRGGYTSCRFLVVKNTLKFSKNLRPKRSLNARLGHSKTKRQSTKMVRFLREFLSAIYVQTLRAVVLILVKCFSCLVITSQGVGVMTWEFGRIFLLCLLYLPIPIRGQNSSNRPKLFNPKVVENIFFRLSTFYSCCSSQLLFKSSGLTPSLRLQVGIGRQRRHRRKTLTNFQVATPPP